jgi:hypothetical protein
MSKAWPPYYEFYDSRTGRYLLFKQENPNPIKESNSSIFKDHVSILLIELLKGSNTVNESVINTAISMIDEQVRKDVRAAKDTDTAVTILALKEDLRFGDLTDSQRDKLLNWFHNTCGSVTADAALPEPNTSGMTPDEVPNKASGKVRRGRKSDDDDRINETYKKA